ncbi:PLP-dependent aminotransferase family protein [Sneathiella limimaris]|uniref:aminotransferase-like domain-containing protein n=1 Tax=Sneathiella limimaris TaxID=1964213 RepID=UPI00146C5DD5|nr:PLP-dependent aminotransferase family protein [Sneathiella limimaris]
MKSDEVVSYVQKQIQAGQLKSGDRLPTHREMAWELNCSVGTVTRAYGELERRGLTFGQVGRGTFVAPTRNDDVYENALSSFDPNRFAAGAAADLSLNRFFHPETGSAFANAFASLSERKPPPSYSDYIETRGRDTDLQIAEDWVSQLIGTVDKSHIVVCQGTQSGLYLTMKSMTKPGDTIAVEAFGYPGIKAAAMENRLKTAPVDMDDGGIVPSSFAELVQRHKIRMLVTNPTNQNPTGTTLSLERRHEIVKIAKENNIPIVEDGVYAPFQHQSIPSFYELAPEISIFLTSFSKVFSPALRVGYIVSPHRFIPKLISASKAINWTTSTISLDVVAELVQSGVVEKHRQELIREGRKRFQAATSYLENWMSPSLTAHSGFLPQLWLRLPDTLTPSEFTERARQQGIIVIGGDRFAMSRLLDDHYVRVCLMATQSRNELERALVQLKSIFETADAQPLIP